MTNPLNKMLLRDERVNCTSIMTAMTVEQYLNLVEPAYMKRGGLAHQRDALKTTTAKRIRSRMVSDFIAGAVLPPVVVGAVVDAKTMVGFETQDPVEIVAQVSSDYTDRLSIIDGMQRTTAVIEAVAESQGNLKDRFLRVEFWIAENTESLIYRMLVLNTGQVPWNLSRQLQVVYAPLIEGMKNEVNFVRVLDVNAGERRTKAGEYSPDSLAELFIAFGLRKTDIDTQESLADEFSRLDMTEALASHHYRDYFYPSVQMMVDLDCAFSRFDAEIEGNSQKIEEMATPKVKKGRSIFDSKPARIGFIVAVATFVLGRVGMKQDEDRDLMLTKLAEIRQNLDVLLERIAAMDSCELENFLKLDVLTERLYGQKRSAVGRYERAFFENGFKVLIEERFAVPDMEPCWRA